MKKWHLNFLCAASSGYAGLDVAALIAVRKALKQLDMPESVQQKGLKAR